MKPTILILALAVLTAACHKKSELINDKTTVPSKTVPSKVDSAVGTYTGSLHSYGSYRHDTTYVSWDTTYPAVMYIEAAGSDSVRVRLNIATVNYGTFYYEGSNVMNYSNDPTHHGATLKIMADKDSAEFSEHYFGGYSTSYSSKTLAFTGKK